ncbi:MAG: N-acetyl-gamma-glutamyl-phosphate reductase, partial [Chloroflexota bacterium]
MLKIGIFGASGYTGFELVRILKSHPAVEIVFATSETYAGSTLHDIYPTAPLLDLVSAQEAPLEQADIVFLCLPHGAAAPTAVRALEAGLKVIDLSADFRLHDPASYAQWYGLEHPAPHLLAEAVYGLTEFARAELPAARLVANPGCYPTSVLLPLQPLLSAGALSESGTIIADSKSGVSGAGRSPKQHTHFVEVANNLSPYAIGRTHRHLPEMEQELSGWSANPTTLIFSPHLLPVPRGILSTIYVPLKEGWTEADIRALYHDAFEGEPFVELLPTGQHASLAHVTMTNRCVFSLTVTGNTVIISSAIDN